VTVRLEGVRKVFPDGTAAVRGLDLEVGDGELLVLVGPSGSGKSTVLRMVAGLEQPSEGRVWIGGEDVTELEPQRRDVAMVFQSYALYPHKTVRENLAFGLRVRGRPASEIQGRVDAVAGLLDITELLGRKPAQLSGGQRQRVALGRAIVRTPCAFLLDEPLSNLDPTLRHRTRTELARLHRRLGVTTLYVTHDQEEAMTLGQRVAVLRGGQLEQVAPPMELYERPATRFVASFIGSPAMNLVDGRIERTDGAVRFVGSGVRLELAGAATRALDKAGKDVLLGIRPHDVVTRLDEANRLRGVVELVEPRGNDVVARVKLEASASLTIVLPPEPRTREGDVLDLCLPPDRLHFFDPISGKRLG
jgi:multiple sugar transport system ATP-binding protein